ncbi:MAG: ATP-binding protein [Alphaproteobacteria bacterium]|nr:ATP-binding protein [Alphaproteobacteria bacterium]
MTFFSRFRRIVGLTYGVILFCAIALLWVLYNENLEGRLSSLRLRLLEQTQALDYLLRIRYDAVNGMRLQAEDFIKTPFAFSDINHIALQTSADGSYFHLDTPKTHFQLVGNITGIGAVEHLKEEVWEEIHMAYALNPLFKVIKENIKTTSALRYISKSGFQNLYPWSSSFQTKFQPSLLYEEAFSAALPSHNPKREIFWTDAFVSNQTGELMQTCSAPVYRGNRFLGIVALDFTLEAVDYFIDSIYYRNGRLLVVNDKGTVVSDTEDDNEKTRLIRAHEVLPKGLSLERILSYEEHSLTEDNGYWVYRARTDFAPWNVLFYINATDLGIATLLHVGPSVLFVLIFGMLFLLFTNKLISKEFINPTQRLVSHISEKGQGKDGQSYDDIQEPWHTWFDAVSQVFEQNRALVLKLEEHIQTLDAKVQERTKEISKKNEALQRALVDLRKAQQQVIVQEKLAGLGAITAGIAHEIKNPLNFIINFSEVCQEFTEEAKALLKQIEQENVVPEYYGELNNLITTIAHNMQRIDQHAHRADSIVKSMLVHAKGGTDVEQDTDINQLLDENTILAISAFRSQGISPAVEKSFSPTLITKVYRQALGRVLLNMIHNACYALNQKKLTQGDKFDPVLSLSTKKDQGMIEIRIKDNGPGIPFSVKKRIFDPFFTTKPAGSGTGLGLSLSYDIIVNQHHGTLAVESQEGQFTEFIIRIPEKKP